MAVSAAPFARRNARALARIATERRRHKRFSLALLGRFMRADKEEFPCTLRDISVGGIAIASTAGVAVGERIVAYFDELGGLEGSVARLFDGGFAVRLSVSQHKREKLAAQIMWLVNRHELGGAAERRHERVAISERSSTLRLADGAATPCRIIDVSLSGASLGTDARPPVGEEITLGRLRARVMRHHDQGIGVQFLDIQDPEALRRYFG